MPNLQFKRLQNTPVIAKGGTYGGIVADALAAPSICWDGTRFVMTVSAWNIANSKWYTLFFTSSNLTTWTYVANSIRSPAGSDYIIGNGSIISFGGRYLNAYNHYASTAPASAIHTTLDYSADLLSWTNILDPVASTGADSHLVLNPYNSLLELWSTDASTRAVLMSDSPDGTTWTSRGTQITYPAWTTNSAAFGEAHAFYTNDGARYLTTDISSVTPNGTVRFKSLFTSASRNTTYTSYGTCLGANPFNSWESWQVFDGNTIGPFDLGNGLGSAYYTIYAGGDNNSATDNTDSSVGLAYAGAYATTGGPPSIGLGRIWRIRRRSATWIIFLERSISMNGPIRPGDPYKIVRTLSNSLGNASFATTTPVANFVHNGVVDTITALTVSTIAGTAQWYLISGTMGGSAQGYAASDFVDTMLTATINGATVSGSVDTNRLVQWPTNALPNAASGAGNGILLGSTGNALLVDSSGDVTANSVTGNVTGSIGGLTSGAMTQIVNAVGGSMPTATVIGVTGTAPMVITAYTGSTTEGLALQRTRKVGGFEWRYITAASVSGANYVLTLGVGTGENGSFQVAPANGSLIEIGP